MRQLEEPQEHSARGYELETLREQRAHRADAERTDLEPLAADGIERRFERRRLTGPPREEKSDRPAAQSARCERETVLRCSIEPRHVVDGDDHRSLLGEGAHDTREPRRDGDRFGRRALGLRAQDRHVERPSLRRRNAVEGRRVDLVEQIGERDERELQLRLARACDEHVLSARARRGEPGLPHRRLADTGLPDERERTRRPSTREEALDARELDLPPDHERRNRSPLHHSESLSSAGTPPTRLADSGRTLTGFLTSPRRAQRGAPVRALERDSYERSIACVP